MDQMTERRGQMTMQEGDRFVCPNCDCAITLNRHGDPARMPDMRPFTCCCGTTMQQEHGRA